MGLHHFVNRLKKGFDEKLKAFHQELKQKVPSKSDKVSGEDQNKPGSSSTNVNSDPS